MNAPETPACGFTRIQRHSRLIGKWVSGLGLLFYSGLIFGGITSLIAMQRAFASVSEDTETHPVLPEAIQLALRGSATGLVCGLVGSVLIVVSLLYLNQRQISFYALAMFLSFIGSIVTFPTGLIFTLPIAVLFYSKRQQFGEPTAQQGVDPNA